VDEFQPIHSYLRGIEIFGGIRLVWNNIKSGKPVDKYVAMFNPDEQAVIFFPLVFRKATHGAYARRMVQALAALDLRRKCRSGGPSQ